MAHLPLPHFPGALVPAPEAARPVPQGCGVHGVGLLEGETFPAQPRLHLPGVGSPQHCDGDPSKVWVGKMCCSQ